MIVKQMKFEERAIQIGILVFGLLLGALIQQFRYQNEAVELHFAHYEDLAFYWDPMCKR